MDRLSILGPTSATSSSGNVSGAAAARPAHASVSAAIADANAHLSPLSETAAHVQVDDASHSLAEMAHRDLDAALQLLTERAQYITEATGAAIALRRGDHNDMLCRASSGSSAPELGALISMEYGLSGESVRTRQTQRCEDAENDSRVNREGCHQLGIASVVVMPILSNDQVLGVFQLFSGRAHAFADRDVSALRRLCSMVETAVKHAIAAQTLPEFNPQLNLRLDEDASRPSQEESPVVAVASAKEPTAAAPAPSESVKKITEPEKPQETKTSPEVAPKKPLFWSAATQAQNSAPAAASANSTAVPAGLRNLQKCQSCGFPVSSGRTFCVECEEKQWRGQRVSVPGKETSSATPAPYIAASVQSSMANVPVPSAEPAPRATTATTSEAVSPEARIPKAEVTSSPLPIKETSPNVAQNVAKDKSPDKEESKNKNKERDKEKEKEKATPVLDTSTLFASSAAPSESWLSANKYVLAVLLVVALIVAILAWMR